MGFYFYFYFFDPICFNVLRLTEEATSENTWAPDTRTLSSISRSAFEIDDYTRIVEILHKRFLGSLCFST